MSKIKFSPELFLETQELNRFQKFIFEDGWNEAIKNNTISYGIVKNSLLDEDFNFLKITDGGFVGSNRTLQINDGVAVYLDSDGKVGFMRRRILDKFTIQDDGNWYWVKISPVQRTIEETTCSIDAQGNLVGLSQKFTEILRGQPNFPSTIRLYKKNSDGLGFTQSQLNNGEYEVLEVTSDSAVILQGEFIQETDLYVEVVGTFTPGYLAPEEDKGVFAFDDLDIELIEEVPNDGFPNKPSYVVNQEFLIARVKLESGDLIIEDFRYEIFKQKSDIEIEFVSDEEIPFIGVTKASFQDSKTTMVDTVYTVEWGFKASSYSVDPTGGVITINSGSGGKYKQTSNFNTGDFNGYKVLLMESVKNNTLDNFYSRIEKVFKITSSTKQGSSIKLTIDNFSPIDFQPYDWVSGVTYLNKQKVNTVSGVFELQTQSNNSLNPVQDVYNASTTYTLGSAVSYGGDVYVSLQNGNSGNTPSSNPAFWELTWKNKQTELLIVPDCEDIILELSVGEDVTGLENDKLKRIYSFPVILGSANINAVSINLQGGENQDNKVYNLKYKLKTNKVCNFMKVLPSDSVGYVDELGTLTPYNTQYRDKAFLKAIRSANSYKDFRDRVDLGDLNGVEIIANLKSKAAEYVANIIPLQVGVNKKFIRVTGSEPIDTHVKFKLLNTSATIGNKFQIFIESVIEQSNYDSLKLVTVLNGNGDTILTLTNKNLQNSNQIIWCEFAEDGWFAWLEDNSFRGENHFTQGSVQRLVASTSVVNVGGINVLLIDGSSNHIELTNDTGGEISIGLISSKNGRVPNTLFLAKRGGDEISLPFTPSSNPEYYTIVVTTYGLTKPKKLSSGWSMFVLQYDDEDSFKNYYKMVYAESDRSRIGLLANQPFQYKSVSPDTSDRTASIEDTITTITLPNNNSKYLLHLFAKSTLSTSQTSKDLTLSLYEGDSLIDKSGSHFESTLCCTYIAEITATGQTFTLKGLVDAPWRQSNTKIHYTLFYIDKYI